ncbi:hypothetical protein Ae201684P_020649 [Aphanomyces euteiches]|nr:hypothetical protein Ae201684P_020649 [Aphanomyces euteiches]
MESKDVVVEHMLPLAASVKSKLLSSLDATVVQATCVWSLRLRVSWVQRLHRLRTCCLCRSWTLLVCVASRPTMTQRSAWPARIASKRCRDYSSECRDALCVFQNSACNPQPSYRRRMKRHLVVKLLGITVETCTKEELEPQYSLLKEFVREALHDNFLLVRVEARQVFSVCMIRGTPERVNEFVYLPAPRIRAVLMADGYATTGIGLALQRKFQSKTPAAVKRDPPRWSVLACCQSTQRGGLSHAAGCAALGCAVHGDSGGMAAVAQF